MRPAYPAWLACESPGWSAESGARESGPSVSAGPGERARLSAAAGSLLDRWDDVCRREEPPRYESGLRAHGSNQRFHRLLGHAVARALTTAPSLTDLSPTAARILIPQGWRRKGPPGTLSRKAARISAGERRCLGCWCQALGDRAVPGLRAFSGPQGGCLVAVELGDVVTHHD